MEENKEENISKEEYVKIKRSNEKKKAIIVILVFAMIIMLVLLIMYYFNGKNSGEPIVSPTPVPVTPTPTIEPTIVPTPEITVSPVPVTPTATLKPTATPTTKPTVTPKPTATSKPTSTPVPADTFVYEGENGIASYGYAIVKGYAEVKKDQKDCGDAGCDHATSISINDTVDFHIVSTDSKNFKKTFIEGWYSDPDGDLIRIGCIKNGKLSYTNYADEFNGGGSRTFTLSEELTNKIISSSVNNQITLKLEKKKLSEYDGTPNQCDSNITTIELVK